MAAERKTAPCDECGAEVTKLLSQSKPGGWYCSRKCAGKGKYKKSLSQRWAGEKAAPVLIRQCAVCGKSFSRRGTAFRNAEQVTCSLSCKASRQNQQKIAAGTWKKPVKKRRGETTDCGVCGQPVYRSKSTRANGEGKFCSRECFDKYQSRNKVVIECAFCKKHFSVALSKSIGRKYCSKSCDNDDNKYPTLDRLHNGRNVRINQHGYLWIYEPTHPKSFRGYVAEHRWLIEQKIGRLLERREHVHHKNGDKQDNRMDNLQLLGINEHMKLTNCEVKEKRKSTVDELAEYKKRYGPLT
jgi:endogenous inhibitor of DNA gyrase (YacG/DUF329 family)